VNLFKVTFLPGKIAISADTFQDFLIAVPPFTHPSLLYRHFSPISFPLIRNSLLSYNSRNLYTPPHEAISFLPPFSILSVCGRSLVLVTNGFSSSSWCDSALRSMCVALLILYKLRALAPSVSAFSYFFPLTALASGQLLSPGLGKNFAFSLEEDTRSIDPLCST